MMTDTEAADRNASPQAGPRVGAGAALLTGFAGAVIVYLIGFSGIPAENTTALVVRQLLGFPVN